MKKLAKLRTKSLATLDPENTRDENLCSPSSWLCELAREKMIKLPSSWNPLKQHRVDTSSETISKLSWRQNAANSILSQSDDDFEKDLDTYDSDVSSDYLKHGETRIIAPNVAKLSPSSCVEVKMVSDRVSALVLCSVDVLKMKSAFFHDILIEQERNVGLGLQPNVKHSLWRDPLVIHGTSPIEAASLLELLHEGRVLMKCTWNSCWVKLSVSWVVEELVQEFARQTEVHLEKVVNVINHHHWRTNPKLLVGAKIALFDKVSATFSKGITGVVIDGFPAQHKVGFKLQLDDYQQFSDLGLKHFIGSPKPQQMAGISPFSPRKDVVKFNLGKSSSHETLRYTPKDSFHDNSHLNESLMNYIEVSDEIIWIQTADDKWEEADSFSYSELKNILSSNDIRMFWEMIKALIELPEIAQYVGSNSIIRSNQDLANLLKKRENRILWSNDCVAFLPREVMQDLLISAFVA